MTPHLPSTRTAQPAHRAVKLALKDELRTLSFNLQQGAHWLLEDLAPNIVQRVEPKGFEAPLQKLHQLFDVTAQATLSTLEAAQQATVITVLQDTAYREARFPLQPLSTYFSQDDQKKSSKLFTDAFYWLIRHALQASPLAHLRLITRQQAVDQAYWQVLERHPALVARVRTGALAGVTDAQDHAALCAAILRMLLTVQPLHDATLPPWAHRSLATTGTQPAVTVLPVLLTVVLSVGLITASDAPVSDVPRQLALATQLVSARLPSLEAALATPATDSALAHEFAFLFRHA